ncbi:hypothetical protein ACFXG1_23505 [Streptomyces sp. NPDC059248]|uniref:hypothetical protein n=1 Tax=Streptomyces sp. NPDC059248 TaxID=3346791 RepID=UPI003681635B
MRHIMKQTFVGLAAAASVVAFSPTASAANAPIAAAPAAVLAPDCSKGVGGGADKYGWAQCSGLSATQRIRVEVWCPGRVEYGQWVHNGQRSVKYCSDLSVPSRVDIDYR